MRLSEMTADKAFDVVADLTPHIANILENKEVKKLLKKVEIKETDVNEKLNKGFDETVKKITPFIKLIFKDSKEDIFSIVGIMNDLSLEEVKKINFIKFNEMIIDTVNDRELIELFTSRIGFKLTI